MASNLDRPRIAESSQDVYLYASRPRRGLSEKPIIKLIAGIVALIGVACQKQVSNNVTQETQSTLSANEIRRLLENAARIQRELDDARDHLQILQNQNPSLPQSIAKQQQHIRKLEERLKGAKRNYCEIKPSCAWAADGEIH